MSMRKCAKCGLRDTAETSVTFHRFPLPGMHGSLKARVWAIYCFPECDWSTEESLKKLYKEHKMLCSRHFDASSFTNNEMKRLNKFAIPVEAQHILARLLNETKDFPEMIPALQLYPNTTIEEPAASSSYAQEIQSTDKDTTIEEPAASSSYAQEIQSTDKGTFIEEPIASTSYAQEIQSTDKISRRRKSILSEIEIQKLSLLTPKKRKLYDRCRKNLSEIIRLRKNIKNKSQEQKNILTHLSNNKNVNKLIEGKFSKTFALLLQSQIKNAPRKLQGHRWNIDEKVLALSIYKRSSSCYRLLKRLFCLPSEGTLKTLLNKIPLTCGINEHIFIAIKKITKERVDEDNICIVAFDEMSIRRHLSYNEKYDQIDGFQDHGSQGRTSEIATHALTFMAIGIRKKWKQPLAFYFSGEHVTADRLMALLKEVLGACFSSGLRVVGIVCDGDGTNTKSINILGSTTDHPYFEFKGQEIVTIADPPHLLKCFRNNFMKHNIEYTRDTAIDGRTTKIKCVAKWSHIEEFFKLDNENPNFVFAPALTKTHLQPNGKQKMKVSLASQVLSHSVAAGIYAKVASNELSQEATATAFLISKMDSLFDAVNGETPDLKNGKPYLTNMTGKSKHKDLFTFMNNLFVNLKFVGMRSQPPSTTSWRRTMNAVCRLFNNLKNTYNIDSLSTKRLNQDPLENCFGCIRSNCGCNQNPNTVQFVAALKTGLVSNLMNTSKNKNCFDDNNEILSDLKHFISADSSPALEKSGIIPSGVSNNNLIAQSEEDDHLIDIPQCSGEMQACAYVSGFIAKKMQDCNICKSVMFAEPNTEFLRACFSSGLRVVGIVCDGDGTNTKSINILGSTTDHPYFEFKGQEIVTIADPPHLLKCFRNNFMKHNIEYTRDTAIDGRTTKIKCVAKWSHIEEFFKLDNENPNFVFAPALTKTHLQPNGK